MRTVPKKGRGKRKPVLYALEPITAEGMDLDGPLKAEGPYVVEGELMGSIVVSVPETMSNHTAQELDQQLTSHFKRDVCIVTHNISFLRLKRLRPNEAAKVTKRIVKTE